MASQETWNPERRGFWLAVAVALLILFALGAAFFALLGWNPYVGASLAMGGGLLRTVYEVARS